MTNLELIGKIQSLLSKQYVLNSLVETLINQINDALLTAQELDASTDLTFQQQIDTVLALFPEIPATDYEGEVSKWTAVRDYLKSVI
jgi:hypothetical protein